ncbi:FHA domain protein [compost metagenome]
MLSLQTDFVRNGGTYMVLSTEEGLVPTELSRVQCGMIASTSIPHLLKLDVKEIDLEVSLHYDITGKRMLSQCMKSEKISMPEFYVILLQMVNALDESKQYMLQPSNYWLNENYIFVDGSLNLGKVFLTYIPLQEEYTAEPIQSQLLSLIMKLITSVSILEGIGVQKIMQLCGSDLFSLAGFRKLLRELLAGDGQSYPEAENPKRALDPNHELFMNRRSQAVSQPITKEPSRNLPRPTPPVKGIVHESDLKDPEESNSMERDTPRLNKDSSSIRTYVLLGAGLFAALIWKFLYLDNPGTSGLYICGGITALVIAGVIWFLSGHSPISASRRRLSSEQGAIEEHERRILSPAEQQPRDQGRWGGWSLDEFLTENKKVNEETVKSKNWDESEWRWNDQFLVHDQGLHGNGHSSSRVSPDLKDTLGSVNASSNDVPHPAPPTRIEDQPDDRSGYYEQLSGKTEMLVSSRQATVLLSGHEQASNHSLTPYLERVEQGNGTSERIILSGVSFVIGRSEEVVQYVEKTVGTSRAHVELTIQGRKCSIRDLGSRNGTKLQGEVIAPYKEYPLEVGHTFSIATTSFKLCM